MQQLSVVIVCKNEAAIIGKTLGALDGLTDDIIIYDNGSTDRTIEIARSFKAQIHQGNWEGYGATKNNANGLAKYDWILSLDADEVMDAMLKKQLLDLSLTDEKKIYAIRRRNYLKDKWIRFGEWGVDFQNRLFNRKTFSWDHAEVHESLVIHPGTIMERLPGYVHHQTMKDMTDYSQKTVKYAILAAEKYFRKGKRSGWIQTRMAPGFSFFRHYIMKLGFLDGREGFICAKMSAHYTFLKYTMLKELEQQNKRT